MKHLAERVRAAMEVADLSGRRDHGKKARWSAPSGRLADEQIELRLPAQSDAEVLHAYARMDDGLDGGWVPLPTDASLDSCRALIEDWLAGWESRPSFHGPAFVIQEVGRSRLVGQVGLSDRPFDAADDAGGTGNAGGTGGAGRAQESAGGAQDAEANPAAALPVVELVYGVAPDFRARGYATRATRLVANWLLRAGLASGVELHIGQANLASQWVAVAAGFVPAGTAVSHVQATGKTQHDLRFVMLPR